MLKSQVIVTVLVLLPALLLSCASPGNKKGGSSRPRYELGMEIALRGHVSDADFKNALEHFNAGLAQDPKETKSLNGIAMLYLKRGQFARARGYYEKVLTIAPKDATASSGIGEILLKQKLYDEAKSFIEDKIRDEKDPTRIAKLEHTLGSIYLVLKQYDKAEQSLSKTLKYDHFNLMAILKISYIYIVRNQIDRARLLLLNYTQNKGEDPKIDNLLATLFVKEEKYYDAIDLFKKVVEKDPNLIEPYLNLASIYLRFQNYQAALDICTKGLGVDSENVDLLVCKATSMVYQDNVDQAIPVLKSLIVKQNKPELSYVLGIAHWKSGRLEDALSAFNTYKLETKAPDNIVDKYISRIEKTIIELQEQKRKEAEMALRAAQEAKIKQQQKQLEQQQPKQQQQEQQEPEQPAKQAEGQ